MKRDIQAAIERIHRLSRPGTVERFFTIRVTADAMQLPLADVIAAVAKASERSGRRRREARH